MDLSVYFCRARSSAQGHKSVRVGRVFHHAAAEDYLQVCNTSHGKKLSWKKEPKHQILEQGMAGEGISLTEQLQAQTLRFANSQPLIKKTPLYNMDIKYKLEKMFCVWKKTLQTYNKERQSHRLCSELHSCSIDSCMY